MSGHELLNSNMLYIHPPLAITGYVFIFLFAFFLFRSGNGEKKIVQRLGVAAWMLTFLGLVTGMIWAQLAWGSYWSWDPKETLTLALFVELSFAEVAYLEKRPKVAKWLGLFACILTIITLLSSFIIVGLHSFAV
jgi:ABC-type transport system involved in cytochrome c biogenesis permease subunit